MKILHIYRDLWGKGGVPHEVMSLIREQIKLGMDVYTISSNYKKELPLQFEIVKQNAKNYEIGRFSNVKKIIKEIKPDIIHTYSLSIPEHTIWFAFLKEFNIPIFLSFHGILNPYLLKKRFGGKINTPLHYLTKLIYRKIYDRSLLKITTGFHFLSEFEKNLLPSFINLEKKVSVIVPNGVDLEFDYKVNKSNKKNDEVTFLYIGRVDIYQKGLDIVLDAYKEIQSKTHFKLNLYIAGPSVKSDTYKLKKKVNNLKLKNVIFLDYVNNGEKVKLFEKADYFLHISRFEGMARAAREAIANNIPLIASYESNFGSWVEKYNLGFACSVNTKSLINALKKAINIDNSKYNSIVSNVKTYKEIYTWKHVAKNIINAYKKCL